jgi:signal transduction histidine kinase
VARIEGQTLKLNRERFDLGMAIADAIRDGLGYYYYDGINRSRGTSAVEIKYEPRHVYVNGDPGRLVQVISNLLSNALKFTEEGEVRVTVDEDIDRGKGSSVTVTVADTGEGIDPQVLPRLFQKFATSARFTSGTGLGLFISKSIVEAHGGRMWAGNNPDGRGGAFFSFTIPK